MAKKLDGNKIIILIACVLIVIAIIITCAASVYERTAGSKSDDTTKPSVSETVGSDKKDNKGETENTSAKPQDTTAASQDTTKNATGKYRVATKDDPLGIRLQAAKDAERVSEIPKGSEIEILAVFDTWGYVDYDGVGGWVAMEYVELISADDKAEKNKPGKYTINTQDDPLGIRTKPEQDAERSGEVPKGEEVEILAVYGDWGYVNYEGTNGWLSFTYLKKA
ncbi:MAG: SH3 domain-containing protein [Clostridia bacterium]|nr:SH3 domain-containing protein [Clostridia bacterium]